MPDMTNPHDALDSFQEHLANLRLQAGALDPTVMLCVDSPTGTPRFTYVRLDGRKVTAFAMFAATAPWEGLPCFALGYAVPEKYRNQGRAKDIVEAGMAELTNGLSRVPIKTFYVEAVVGLTNLASQRVSAATISDAPASIVDEVSGLPALRYLRRIG